MRPHALPRSSQRGALHPTAPPGLRLSLPLQASLSPASRVPRSESATRASKGDTAPTGALGITSAPPTFPHTSATHPSTHPLFSTTRPPSPSPATHHASPPLPRLRGRPARPSIRFPASFWRAQTLHTAHVRFSRAPQNCRNDASQNTVPPNIILRFFFRWAPS